MRRFEFRDSKSDKFWEIHTEANTVTARWGRIGTRGQEKSRDFGSHTEAQSNAEKQIAAKVKKGYVEANQPPPNEKRDLKPADQASAEATPVGGALLPDEAQFEMPATWKARIHPRRGGRFIPARRYVVRETFSRLKRAADSAGIELPEAWQAEDWTEEKLRGLNQKLAQTYEGREGQESLLRLVLTTHGLMPAIEVFLEFAKKQPLAYVHGSRTLRTALARCSEESYAEARTRLNEARRQVDPCICAYLMPDEATWFDESMKNTSFAADSLMLTCVRSVDALATTRAFDHLSDGVAETLAVEFGHEALGVLTSMFKHASWTEAEETIVKVIAQIPHDAAVTTLFDLIEEKAVRRALPTLFQRFPQRCIRVGITRPALKSYVSGWVAEHPAAADAVMASASKEVQDAIRALRKAQVPALPEAPLASLHPFFKSPPWTRKRATTKPIAVTLEAELPPPFGKLTAKEETIANRELARAEEAKDPKKQNDLWENGDPNGRLGLVLYGNEAVRQRAAKSISESWWYNEPAQRMALGLIKGAPRLAGPILTAVGKDSLTSIVPSMVALASKETAQLFLEGLEKKTRRKLAIEWATRFPDFAARAWIPVACGTKKKLRRLAESGLRALAQRGHEPTVRQVGADYGAQATAAIDALLAVDPLESPPRPVPNNISFLNTHTLPRPKLKDRNETLPGPAMETIALAFSVCTLDEVYDGVEVIKSELEANSLAQFAWGLFEQWLSVGAPSKESWVLSALGLVGNDEIASKLTPMIRAWPGESQHQRAVNGLDVLLAIGSDVSLMHLNSIAQKVKFKGIKDNARQRIEQLASSLNLTKEQLADRLVPDLNLDAHGMMMLDYGPRTFTVGFDEALRPVVRDQTGKRRKSLPKPGAKDDPARAKPAEALFKQLKKSVRALASIQIGRLENAMIIGRRWTAKDFEVYLVKHPLLIHLVRRLVWGVYEKGGLVEGFRVTEDSSLANVQDEEFELKHTSLVGVVHAIDLPPGQAAAWGELFSDYELLQPFLQLGRPIHELTPEERESKQLLRHRGTPVSAGRLLGLLNKGWERGEAQDGGVVHWLSLPLSDQEHELRLWLGDSGLWIGMGVDQDQDPCIEGVSVVQRRGWAWKVEDGVMPLKNLPRSIASELIDTVEGLVNA